MWEKKPFYVGANGAALRFVNRLGVVVLIGLLIEVFYFPVQFTIDNDLSNKFQEIRMEIERAKYSAFPFFFSCSIEY